MARLNVKLIVGIVMIVFFLLIAVFGSVLSPYKIDELAEVKYIQTEEGKKLSAPPFPPTKEHLFGTDQWGYDILTLLLHGAKFTIFTVIIVALLRVIIGGSLGIYVALHQKALYFPMKSTKLKINIFSGFPVFIILYFILIRINIEPVLSPLTLSVIVGSLMVILGVVSVYDNLYTKTKEMQKNLYISASQVLGGNKLHIAKQHILPSLKSQILIIFMNEIIQVLHLIGQLGIFNLFVGGTFIRMDPPVFISITKEWAGLIGQFRSTIYYYQWILFFPLLSYLLLLFSFYLVSQGIIQQEKVKQRKSPIL
ncbi:peptide ABC transporter permease [Cytobacillus massiliigabonensis]|uniref:peptide ABC transporter permease n=1 Tax=Cytobacillus massiliigabonensis TaxID=1871011 RepID=UPI000C8630B2|nr:peptide ABC transporter permease [Cytobacillus massiliigabonensis]